MATADKTVRMPASASTSRCMVVYCTHGLADPLVGPLMLDYVIRLQRNDGGRDVLFFTEEPPDASVPAGIKEQLDAARIEWVPLRYDVRGWQWMQKLRNVIGSLRRTRSFVRGYRERWLVGYLSFGGTYAMLAALLGMGRAATVCFEPHSQYMVELGIWGRFSPKTFLMRWFERLQMRRCAVLVVPTTAVGELVHQQGPKGRVETQAIAIDIDRCSFDAAARSSVRARHGLQDTIVLAYVGKFGGIYHSVNDYLRFMDRALQGDPTLRFMVITQVAEIERIRSHALYPSLRDHLLLHPPVPAAELHRFLSAADFGVIAIPPTPSQRFRTPVKTAHYWAAGLPIIIPRGVSDDHWIAEKEGIGIVIGDLPTIEPKGFNEAIATFMALDPGERRQRCIAAARKYRDTVVMEALLRRLLN